MTGPRLSTENFFNECVNTEIDGLSQIPEKMAEGDVCAATRIFADYIRANLKPEKFFNQPYVKPDNNFMYENETNEAATKRIMNYELISCGTPHKFENGVDWFLNPTYNGYKEWTWQLSRHHEFNILAFEYMKTKNEDIAKFFVEYCKSWIMQATAPDEGTYGGSTECWRTIEIGIRLGKSWNIALHAFAFSPYFTDEFMVMYFRSLWEQCRRLRIQCKTRGNWLIMEMNGLLHINLLYPVFKESEEWLEFALEKLETEIDRQIYPDGFHYELSTNYHQVVIYNYCKVLYTYKAMELEPPEFIIKGLDRMFRLYPKIVMPNGYIPDINDGFYKHISPLLDTAHKLLPQNSEYAYFATDGALGELPKYTSVFLPYSGIGIMRSGWGAKDIWALFDGAPFGNGHQHEDQHNILLYAYGKSFLIEGGNYDYDTSQMRKYVLSTRSHNSVRVDGADQNNRKTYQWKDEEITQKATMKWKSEDKFDSAEDWFDKGYGDELDIDVVHNRRVLFLKDGLGKAEPFFVVIDRMENRDKKPHSYEIIWHYDQMKVEKLSDNMVIGSYEDKTSLAIAAGVSAVTVEIVKGQKTPEYQGWRPLKDVGEHEHEAIPTAVFRIKSENPVRVVSVLYPSQGKGVLDRVISSENSEDTKIEICFKDGAFIEIDEKHYFE